MKGDFTRFTFRPEKQYTSVRLQQGRVQLDADWNEQVDIHAYQMRVMQSSLFGDGAPRASAGFKVGFDTSRGLTLSPGRYIVGGLVCELPASASDASVGATYKDQPFFPSPPLLSGMAAGNYLAYLDVWTRHVTALEDPLLREVALSGPDTTTRTQTVWQLRLLKLDTALGALDTIDLGAKIPASSIKMAARALALAPTAGSSLQPPGSGYLRLDNHLYRVEIHQGGKLGTDPVTFKWSRDNGSVVSQLQGIVGNILQVGPVPLDEERGFVVGCWVSLTDDSSELRNEPGIMCRVTAVEGRNITVQPPPGPALNLSGFGPNPKVRRWDMVTPSLQSVTTGGWIDLEDGLSVQFSGTTCASGDYWLIPARTATRDIEWPRSGSDPAFVPPAGIGHAYDDIASFAWDGTTATSIIDRRAVFPSLSDMKLFDPVVYSQTMYGHTHTGTTDGSPIPRGGIQDGAINGAKIATDSDVKISKLNVTGNLDLLSSSNVLHVANAWYGPWISETSSAAICNDLGSFKALMLIGNRGGVANAPRKVGVWDALEVNGTLKTTSDTDVGGLLSIRGTDLRIDNPSSRGGRDGSYRRALVHDSDDCLTINKNQDFSSGVKVSGQLSMDGRVILNENILRLRSAQSFNHGLGYFGANNTYAGVGVEGPVLFGRDGGGLGTTNVAANEVDGSLYLTGGGYVSIPAFQEDFSGGVTVEAWVRYDSLPSWSRVFDFGGGQSSDNIILANDGTSSTVRFNLHNGASGSATTSVYGTGALATGTWIHICATIDASGTGKLYKNGAQFGNTQTGLALPTGVSRTSNFIGKSNWSNDAAFNGRIAHVRIWKRALSSDQVSDNYTSARPMDTTGLVAWWRLDDGSGTTVRDASGKGRHGTFVPGSTSSGWDNYQKLALRWDNSNNVTVAGRLSIGGSDVYLDCTERRDGATGSYRRALVHNSGDVLALNFASDYTGGVTIGGNTTVSGKLKSSNTKTSTSVSSGTVWSTTASAYTDISDISVSNVTVTGGSCLVLLTLGGVQIEGNTNTRCFFQILYQQSGASTWNSVAISVHEFSVSGYSLRDVQMHAILAPSAGTYNFKVQVYTNTTSSTIKIGYYSSTRTLSVIELA